jgi:hypothetical protein
MSSIGARRIGRQGSTTIADDRTAANGVNDNVHARAKVGSVDLTCDAECRRAAAGRILIERQ